MNTDKLNKWLTLVANLGVIAGIIFLAFEIQQSNRIAIATNEIAIRDSYGSINELIAGNPEIAEILSKSRDADAELTGPEQEMADAFIARMFNIWMASERAFDQGMTSRALLDIAIDDIGWTYDTYPALRGKLRGHTSTYSANSETEVSRTVIELLENQ